MRANWIRLLSKTKAWALQPKADTDNEDDDEDDGDDTLQKKPAMKRPAAAMMKKPSKSDDTEETEGGDEEGEDVNATSLTFYDKMARKAKFNKVEASFLTCQTTALRFVCKYTLYTSCAIPYRTLTRSSQIRTCVYRSATPHNSVAIVPNMRVVPKPCERICVYTWTHVESKR